MRVETARTLLRVVYRSLAVVPETLARRLHSNFSGWSAARAPSMAMWCPRATIVHHWSGKPGSLKHRPLASTPLGRLPSWAAANSSSRNHLFCSSGEQVLVALLLGDEQRRRAPDGAVREQLLEVAGEPHVRDLPGVLRLALPHGGQRVARPHSRQRGQQEHVHHDNLAVVRKVSCAQGCPWWANVKLLHAFAADQTPPQRRARPLERCRSPWPGVPAAHARAVT